MVYFSKVFSLDLGTTYKTAWHLAHRIQSCLDLKEEAMGGVVEVDETYVGGSEKNKHANKKSLNPMANNSKTTVLGIIGRGQRVFAKVVASGKAKDLIPEILKQVKPEAVVNTDQYVVYKRFKGYFKAHNVVIHSAGEYVSGVAHTNTIEGFFSHLKRKITGVHHQVSPKHLQQYVNAISFNWNNRLLSCSDRFNLMLEGMETVTTYKALKA